MKVVVLNTCSLHVGYLGCYGNDWVATPTLDRLAAEGVVFDQHFADNPASGAGSDHQLGSPTARTVWTGRYRFPGPEGEMPQPAEEVPTLPGLLEAHGVGWSLVTAVHPGGERPGTEPLWERTLRRVRSSWQSLAAQERGLLWVDLPSLAPPWDVPAEVLDQLFAEESDEEGESPEPWPNPDPGPLDPEDDIAHERLQNTYAAVVSYFDAQLERVLDVLPQGRKADEVLVCVTAERGLALGEHGIIGDARPWLHDELIHVPLIVRLPGGAKAGRRIFGLTQPVDLPATLLEAFGLTPPASVHGRSLWPLLRGQAEQVRPYACTGWRVEGATEWALRTPQWGYILPVEPGPDLPPRSPQLYVKPDDRWEVNNVVQHHLELAEHLEATLRGFVEATRRPGLLEGPALRDVEAEAAPAGLEQEANANDPGDQS
jgi:arylsulfatase A-like enzyme